MLGYAISRLVTLKKFGTTNMRSIDLIVSVTVLYAYNILDSLSVFHLLDFLGGLYGLYGTAYILIPMLTMIG